MNKYILSLFLIGFLLVPVGFSFAQVPDPDPNSSTDQCVTIVNNLRYRDRDIYKNGEVSTLQDFLQSKGYLNSEPTGYFGLLTFKAVKDFQNANYITPTSGYVGPITRAKIKNLTCGGTPLTEVCCEIFGYGAYMVKTSSTYEMMSRNQCTTGAGFTGGGRNIVDNSYCKSISSNPVISGVSGPQTLNVNQTGTWTVNAYDTNGGNLSYSVNWGDTQYCPSGGGPCSANARALAPQQSATFTHSYSYAGTFNPTFTVTSDNGIRCITTPCNSGGSASTSLSVNVGGTIPASLITVLSPNGGGTLYRGNNFQINWQDNIPYGCPVGANCIAMPVQRYYDISLVSYYPTCLAGQPCPTLVPTRAPYTIAERVYGSAYNWQVGNVLNNVVNGSYVPSGLYTIQVCQTGTGICDSSNSPFTIQ